MAFRTIASVAAVALALVANAAGAVAVPARAIAPESTVGATSQVVGAGTAPRVVLVPQSAIPCGKDKRGDNKVNVSIDVDIEKPEEKNPEFYEHKKGDGEEVNVSIDVDVKKAEEEKQEHGISLVSALTAGGQPQEVPPETTQQPAQDSV